MKINFRQVEILDIARREGKVGVEDLASRFGVTVQTIRRDLSDLDAAGQLDRIHGGAVVASGTSNVAYEERKSHLPTKRPPSRALRREDPQRQLGVPEYRHQHRGRGAGVAASQEPAGHHQQHEHRQHSGQQFRLRGRGHRRDRAARGWRADRHDDGEGDPQLQVRLRGHRLFGAGRGRRRSGLRHPGGRASARRSSPRPARRSWWPTIRSCTARRPRASVRWPM
jgi:DNA-binding transcriptional ArsR family regulator